MSYKKLKSIFCKKQTIIKLNKKTHMLTMAVSFLVGAVGLMVLPLFDQAEAAISCYFQIKAGSQAYGIYTTEEAAAKDLIEVRKQLDSEQEQAVMTDLTCSIEPVEKEMKTVSAMETESAKEILYEVMKEYTVDSAVDAYTIKVDEFTVTVASEGAALAVLGNVKNAYDVNQAYQIVFNSVKDKDISYLVPSLELKEGSDSAGIVSMGFNQSVIVAQNYVSGTQIVSVEEAVAALTKEEEIATIYKVVAGDCLSLIAEKNGMTTQSLMEMNQLTDSENIVIDDELIVTVPEPEVSVWYQEQVAYEEEYQAETQYIDNDSWYTDTQKVISEGVTGQRYVVATVTYSQNSEVSREILEESIIQEAQAKVIERGTQQMPTYIKPLTGGSYSSPYGARWGRMHKGVDWSCSIGTTIKASCGGRVTSAGWQNGYGNCIVINHSDGKQTRYAHLSQILVSAGDRVAQGEKIALSGNTGNSTGPHLHFEILVDGVQVDPMKYLK